VAAFRQSLALNPKSEMAYANLAAVLVEMQDHDQALEACEQALQINPAMTMAHCNRAASFKALNRLPEAAAAYRGAIDSSPQFPEAHFGLSQILLLAGDLQAGWEEYEWRWKLKEYGWLRNMHGTFAQPRWGGESLAGKRLLVYAEQGLGDAIQFIRFIPELKRFGGHVILAVHPPLMKLFAGFAGVEVVPLDQRLPAFDVHSPLLSLPRILATSLATIPQTVPYLHAQPDAVAHWQQRIAAAGLRGNLRVGLVWAGNPGQRGDRLRSPHLAAMAPLLATPDVDFIALQVGAGRDEINAHPLPTNVLDLGGEVTDFADTAAIMSGLDLMVTSCTAPLHLAAALGVPTWGVIPFAPHFYWMLDRGDSPWYPTLRLYRQAHPTEGWSPVVSRVAADLSHLAATRSNTPTMEREKIFA